MNHWQETAEILSRIAELERAGRRAALATVVRISGSAYRRPGAKFLIEDAGSTLGSVSGGCLEADVREVARAVLETGVPSLRHYSTGGDEDVVWGLGLGCNGLVDVFVQPATEGALPAVAERLRELLAGDAPFAIATVLDGEAAGAMLAMGLGGSLSGTLGSEEIDRLAAEKARAVLAVIPPILATSAGPGGRSGVVRIGGRDEREVFVEALPAPPHLIVCGAGDDARPLVAYAADAGFRVTLIDHREALLDPSWFPQAARRVLARPEDPGIALPPAARSLAVVKTHGLANDRDWTRRLLTAGLPYVGLLGPKERTAAILREIGARDPEDTSRVFGPVGLDLGADGPRQVAISIVAELLAFTTGRQPGHLSARREAIHAI